jgi:hypothetical protein
MRCKVRLDEKGSRVEQVDEGCPICLGPLSSVRHLSELVGLRKIGRDDDLTQPSPASASARAPAELGNARVARALVDALRWVDEDGSFDPRGVSPAGRDGPVAASPTMPWQVAEDAADTWPERPR